jgi:hypothetical protein
MYSCTLSVTSALDGVGCQRHAPAALPPDETRTHCIGGWLGPKDGLDGCAMVIFLNSLKTISVTEAVDAYS